MDAFKEHLDSKNVDAKDYKASSEEWLLATALANPNLDTGELRQSLDTQAMISLAKETNFSKDKREKFTQALSTIMDVENVLKDIQEGERGDLIKCYVDSLPQEFSLQEKDLLLRMKEGYKKQQEQSTQKNSVDNLTKVFTSFANGTNPALSEGTIGKDGKLQVQPKGVFVVLPSGKTARPRGSAFFMLQQEATEKKLFNEKGEACFVSAPQYIQKAVSNANNDIVTVTNATKNNIGTLVTNSYKMLPVKSIKDEKLRKELESNVKAPKFSKLVFDATNAKNAEDYLSKYQAAVQYGGTFISSESSRKMVQNELSNISKGLAQGNPEASKFAYNFCTSVSIAAEKQVEYQVRQLKIQQRTPTTSITRQTSGMSY